MSTESLFELWLWIQVGLMGLGLAVALVYGAAVVWFVRKGRGK
jgi:hypothetical protein